MAIGSPLVSLGHSYHDQDETDVLIHIYLVIIPDAIL